MDWVAVGLRTDIPAGTVAPRRVGDVDLAVWCSASGVFHAWGDRCPHRGMRLSHGFVRGETLACIYHGWQYDESGSCAYIPAHPILTPPKTICAQDYACMEVDGMVWIALQPTSEAPPSLGGRLPVRSLEVATSAEVLASKLKCTPASVIVVGGVFDLALALQPRGNTSCMLHALANPDQDLKQVSRHLEKMRKELEENT
ncbi:Rieske 2Fe-2S domain-containing protein [Roseobacter sp.]|uniref:Rieske 2Fe-2S domain-containing protein n=1 Tax=Roseobacter sp. TaxID=1907202 RepID=UPI00385C42A2